MIRYNQNAAWSVPNKGKRSGSFRYVQNANFDEPGVVRMSPRTVKLKDEATSSFGVPVGIGRVSEGVFQVATTGGSSFYATINNAGTTFTEDTGTSSPTTTTTSHGIFWQDRWHVSTATAILSKDADGTGSATYTSRITGLTSGKRHYMCVFDNRTQLAVTDGNYVKTYDTSYNTVNTDLVIPSDYEAVGLAWNSNLLGIITRTGSSASSPAKNARFFIWDGGTTAADGGTDIGCEMALAVCPYQATFAILTIDGLLKVWNGGSLTTVARFPFHDLGYTFGDTINYSLYGDAMISYGDKILINTTGMLNAFGSDMYTQIPEFPAGVWCFDPNVGLYHRYSPSNSQEYRVTVAAAGANTSTDVLTAASGTIPATGGLARIVRRDGATDIGGLKWSKDYYVIKLTSSTFQLAETREKAELGVYADITSQADDVTYFQMYDLVDTAISYANNAGAIGTTGIEKPFLELVVFGGDYPDTDLTNNDTLCVPVPRLENITTLVTSRVFSQQVTDNVSYLVVKHSYLKENDKIIIKHRSTEYEGLPIASPSLIQVDAKGIWTARNGFYTTADLTNAIAYLAADTVNNELEVKITAGTGAGSYVKIDSITEESGTFDVQLAEDVVGVTDTTNLYFIIENWEKSTEITASSQTNGIIQLPIARPGSWHEFKIILQGSDIQLYDLFATNEPDIRI